MQNEVLRVSLLTISPHNRAILEFFFAGAGKALFRIVPDSEAQAFIIDYDHPGAHEEWQKINSAHVHPCIVLSIRDVSLPNSIWVSKPLTSKALIEAAKKVQTLVSSTLVTASSYATIAPKLAPIDREDAPPVTQKIKQGLVDLPPNFGLNNTVKSAPLPNLEPPKPIIEPSTFSNEPITTAQQPAVIASRSPKPLLVRDNVVTSMAEPPSTEDPIKRQQRWALLCGTLPDTSLANIQRDGRFFDPNHYVLGAFMQAVQQAKQSGQAIQVFLTHQHYILLMPQPYYAFSTLDIHGVEFANLCTTPITLNQVHLHTPTETELSQLDTHIQQHSNHLYDLDACVWTMSLLTSGGRLIQTLDPSHLYQLKHWPNLTRVESIPHVMSLAAMWTQQAATPFDIAKQLGIPQRYVFAFHSAATYLNLLQREQTAPNPNPKTEPKKNRGLFSRLLKRLLGGGAK